MGTVLLSMVKDWLPLVQVFVAREPTNYVWEVILKLSKLHGVSKRITMLWKCSTKCKAILIYILVWLKALISPLDIDATAEDQLKTNTLATREEIMRKISPNLSFAVRTGKGNKRFVNLIKFTLILIFPGLILECWSVSHTILYRNEYRKISKVDSRLKKVERMLETILHSDT